MTAIVSIQVTELHIENETYSVEQMVAAAEQVLRIEDRVPSVEGDAFDLKGWYRNWRIKHSMKGVGEPTHVQVEAIDEFQARMPWSQLDQALFLFAQEQQPLGKGYPIRLYVPDGSSECLNVKSIVKIWFLHDATLGDEATYGFKNKVTLDEMKLKK